MPAQSARGDFDAAVAFLLLAVAAGSAIALMIVGRQNRELAVANTRAEDKRQEAERKEKVAVAAARAANEQNRSLVDAEVDLIILLERKLRHVPVIQNERDQLLDTAISRLCAAAGAMTDLRRDVDWDPKDENHNWRSLARAHQAQARVSVCAIRSKTRWTSFGRRKRSSRNSRRPTQTT